MKISYNWLKDYLNIDFPAEELSAILTEIGLEVSKVEKFESVKGGLEGLIVGKVLTCVKHPNADKLSVTTVDIGGKILPIVCGAPNVAANQKVVVATVGTTLYDGDNSFDIKKSKIRGEESEGMICAEDEIGLGESHDGILVLDENVEIGTKASDYFDVYVDTVFEVDLTPNRPDAISHFGVARDLYAYLSINSDLKLELKLPDVNSFKVENKKLNIDVEVKNTDACPRYSGLTVSGISVKESPDWIKNRLKAIGSKPINNIVDITNYVLHEIGHPLHAFDAAKIEGNKIVVSPVEKGTKFLALDETEIELGEKDLMICDSKLNPMCIGGVFGGFSSGVKDETSSIFLESAFFNPVWIRKTAKGHGLSTDASYRFERGVDPNNCIWTLKRAAMLITEIAGGKISSEIKDVYPEKIENFPVVLDFKQLDKLMGFVLDRELVKKILTVLEINIISEDESKLNLEVPTYRFEVRREADVIEEIIRIYGYNKIPIPEKITTTVLVQENNISEIKKQSTAHFLTGNGFFEIMTFSLLNRETLDKLEGFGGESAITLQNALSKELDTLRQSLVFGALDSVQRNVNNQNSDLKLYEFGSAYFNTKSEKFDERYQQLYRLSLTSTGLKNKINWKTPENESDFYTLKAYTEGVLKSLGFTIDKFNKFEISDAIYKYGLEYKLGKMSIVKFGAVSRQLLKMYGIDQDVFFAEIEWGTLMNILPKPIPFTEIVKFPKVKRDLALLIDKSVKYSEIEKMAYQVDKQLIKEVSIFDMYEGKNIPEGKKSYAVSFWLQSDTKTLDDKQIKKIMDKLIYNYQNKLGAEIR
ncbi:MAG: phenylalanine--tRNA ligase subunit beta [Bacteroidales bacterium]|nr:phenylalanine--tRNA ligase subunit beta [Bacteroidales bacterium]